jgi:hypothetical protein
MRSLTDLDPAFKVPDIAFFAEGDRLHHLGTLFRRWLLGDLKTSARRLTLRKTVVSFSSLVVSAGIPECLIS